jgi:serine/threonine protein kinase
MEETQNIYSSCGPGSEEGIPLIPRADAVGAVSNSGTNVNSNEGYRYTVTSALSEGIYGTDQTLLLHPPVPQEITCSEAMVSHDFKDSEESPLIYKYGTPSTLIKISALFFALCSVMLCQGLWRHSSSPPSYKPSELFYLVFPKAKPTSLIRSYQYMEDSILNHPSSKARVEIDLPMVGSSNSKKSKLVIAGKFTVADTFCNIAELDLTKTEWDEKQRIQLSLYNSYSGGEVYCLLVNHTFEEWKAPGLTLNANSGSGKGKDESKAGGELLVVGAFDTTDRNSQTTYCSVGEYDGTAFSKVGEGLCNSALSKGMKITAAALAGPHDVYVAGSFTTQVWNGERHKFVNIYNIAHYNSLQKIWSPLPIGQITCSWCRVTVLALAYDSKRRQIHVAGKFDSIDGHNIPAGLAIFDEDTNRLVAHPAGGLTMLNKTQDGVGTALQLDEEAGVLYVMGSFERVGRDLICQGLGAFDMKSEKWTCLNDDARHSVLPSGGGNMLLTPYGLMVAGRVMTGSVEGKTVTGTTWPDRMRPYTIAVYTIAPMNSTEKYGDSIKKFDDKSYTKSYSKQTKKVLQSETSGYVYEWSWLPGFTGHTDPIHALANGFGEHDGTVFIGGDSFVAAWRYEERTETVKKISSSHDSSSSSSGTITRTIDVPITIDLSNNLVRGAVMAISQLEPDNTEKGEDKLAVGYTISVYLIAVGALLGMFIALLCNKSINQTLLAFLYQKDSHMDGISLDTLTYGAMKDTSMNDAYLKAMKTRCVQDPHLLQIIDPQEIILHRIIGEGTFGRVWSARLNSASVAVKEFVFAQAAIAGRSAQRGEIVEEIIGEAGMMAILRHPNVLQLFGCSLTAQAIWIVSELCSLGSLRHLLDDTQRKLPMDVRLKIALQVAEGMSYLHNQEPNIIHRDLKSHNIMVHETFTEKTDGQWTIKSSELQRKESDASNHNLPHGYENSDRSQKMDSEATIVAKIGDWGSARAALSGSRKTMTHGVGTASWLAPEVIKHARCSQQSDVYSYGIILWELATREEVYEDLEGTQIIAQVANDNLRPPVPEGNPLADLMTKCWCERPEDRLSFKQIVKELNKILSDLEEQKTSVASSQRSNFSYNSYQNQHNESAEDVDA